MSHKQMKLSIFFDGWQEICTQKQESWAGNPVFHLKKMDLLMKIFILLCPIQLRVEAENIWNILWTHTKFLLDWAKIFWVLKVEIQAFFL